MDLRVVGHNQAEALAQRVQGSDSAMRRTLIGWVRFAFRWRRRMATVAVGLLAGWLALHVLSGPNGWVVYRNKKLEHQRLEQEVERLQRENDDLERQVQALKNDPKAIEKEAREQLRYARPGEIIYVMPDAKPPAPAPMAPSVSAKQPGN